ncbi:dimethylmenaquinone methyltransferase [Rhodococcus sp. 06-156-3C]|uniref:RraA family protein n=1 Tax=Nocardiaceae TaxID=85025 RepID=UPI000522EA48|nr:MULTISPECIES: RraA family protein [Rhodococcus]OZD08721.1 dimethylmenaquinone methyltransferase [Rhodococcus sp. 06-156-4C]OZD17299.1 dimethylmenaquinone methyltransferase [Rhodococcus sp. 06-156-3C]OZD18636.1 dimethylmenaquinone methyltransferase [Rhodococcus sp. 06-156-4a]OZD25043.1 dimethylmenaquinone methyltransferase [Rhodococcus sp. 06-156-3b]OZD34201.1 dimethylmenaquinone methyltransferase [Rhodococcus sp. 06-156-3]
MTDLARGHATATIYEASKLDVALDPAIRPAWAGARVAGPAYTVQGVGGDNLALHNAVAQAPSGHVLVVDAGGARHGHWGEVLAVAARQRGLIGLVIDGAVRDTVELAAMDFPVFSRGISIIGTRKGFTGAFGVPVDVGGTKIETGDMVVGDADGVIAIPQNEVERVLDLSDARAADEQRIFEELRAGKTTLDLYRFGSAT